MWLVSEQRVRQTDGADPREGPGSEPGISCRTTGPVARAQLGSKLLPNWQKCSSLLHFFRRAEVGPQAVAQLAGASPYGVRTPLEPTDPTDTASDGTEHDGRSIRLGHRLARPS